MAKRKDGKKSGQRSVDTSPLQERFLKAYALMGSVSQAAQEAQCSRGMHPYWLRTDTTYRVRFEAAHAEACIVGEDTLSRRAFYGEPEITKRRNKEGKLIETIEKTKPDTTALIFWLKANMPEKYRERVDVTQRSRTEVKLKVIHDDDWYGNVAHAAAAARLAATDSCATEPGTLQSGGLRPAVGQDGAGAAGDDLGPRSY